MLNAAKDAENGKSHQREEDEDENGHEMPLEQKLDENHNGGQSSDENDH